MKRKMGRVLAVVLSCVMVMMLLVGCGEQQKFIGSWEAELDMTDMMNEEFAQEEEMAEYVSVDKFAITVNMTFNSDGTYSMSANEDSVKAAMESMMESIKKGLEKYFEDMMAAQGISMSVDELLALSGTSMDALMEDAISEDTIDEMVGEMSEEGNFKVADGKLYLSDGKDHAIDENVYQTYEISSDELKLLESFGEEEEDAMPELYPMIFKKIK